MSNLSLKVSQCSILSVKKSWNSMKVPNKRNALHSWEKIVQPIKQTQADSNVHKESCYEHNNCSRQVHDHGTKMPDIIPPSESKGHICFVRALFIWNISILSIPNRLRNISSQSIFLLLEGSCKLFSLMCAQSCLTTWIWNTMGIL